MINYDKLKNSLKRLEEVVGIPDVPNGPKPILRLANENNLIDDIEKWFVYAQARIDTSHDYSEEKSKIALENFLLDVEVLAYGSRVTGKAKKSSDLDLVVFGDTANQIGNLKIAFEESDLPFRVDILNWNEIPESFRVTIKEKYIVIQRSDRAISGIQMG